MKNTWVFAAVGIVGCLGLMSWGCGKAPKAPLDDNIAQNAATDASGAVSPDDLADMQGGTGGLSPLGLTPQGLETLGSPPPGAVLALLNPNNLRARPELLRAVRAPLDVLMYELSQGCYTFSGTCPSLSNRTASCTVAVDFTAPACQSIAVTVAGYQLALYFSGTLSGTIEGSVSPYSLPKVTAGPSGFTITAGDGRWITYSGTVSRQLTGLFGTPITGASWILSVDESADDSSGGHGTARGTRTVEVEFGKYFHAVNAGGLTFTSPLTTTTITISLDIERTIKTSADGLTKTITINDVIITNGVKRTLSGQVTISKEIQGGSGQLASVTIDGSITRSGPRGSITVTFDNVVIDLSCKNKPWAGVMTISNGEKTYTIDFGSGDCGCTVDVTKPDGSAVIYNLCTRQVVGND